jgi:hypothetical protein
VWYEALPDLRILDVTPWNAGIAAGLAAVAWIRLHLMMVRSWEPTGGGMDTST